MRTTLKDKIQLFINAGFHLIKDYEPTKPIKMSGVNKVILIGNLGKDPEVKYLESGTAVANFSLATSETYKDKNGERKTKTEWHNIVLWKGLAEIAEKYLKKGASIYLSGQITTRAWENKDGETRYTTEIVGRELTMLGKSEVKENASQEDDDDLPF